MSRAVLTSLALALVAALGCGDGSDGPTACEVGPDIWQQAVAQLVTSQPVCGRDDDCVRLDTSIACHGLSIDLCGEVMHRQAAARWDAGALCESIEAVSSPSDYACAQQASCIDARPACIAGVCGNAAR
jgi:hypothetical protein